MWESKSRKQYKKEWSMNTDYIYQNLAYMLTWFHLYNHLDDYFKKINHRIEFSLLRSYPSPPPNPKICTYINHIYVF